MPQLVGSSYTALNGNSNNNLARRLRMTFVPNQNSKKITIPILLTFSKNSNCVTTVLYKVEYLLFLLYVNLQDVIVGFSFKPY